MCVYVCITKKKREKKSVCQYIGGREGGRTTLPFEVLREGGREGGRE